MRQSLLAFMISAIVFGAYAAASAFARGWSSDVMLLGFAVYGCAFGCVAATVSMLIQVVRKYSRVHSVLLAFGVGILCAFSLSIVVNSIQLHSVLAAGASVAQSALYVVLFGMFLGLVALVSGRVAA